MDVGEGTGTLAGLGTPKAYKPSIHKMPQPGHFRISVSDEGK